MRGNYNLKNLRKISFDSDIRKNNKKLGLSIQGSRALIIGGAGTIGSNYIKIILKYTFFHFSFI